jgi:hypothetical protein
VEYPRRVQISSTSWQKPEITQCDIYYSENCCDKAVLISVYFLVSFEGVKETVTLQWWKVV